MLNASGNIVLFRPSKVLGVVWILDLALIFQNEMAGCSFLICYASEVAKV